MLGSIFGKEYLKLRLSWPALFALNAAVMAYIWINTRHLFAMDHAEVVWHRCLYLGHIHYGLLKYIPLITGLLLACAQFLPEMRNERLRLSLHLPASPHLLILAHILCGLVALGLILGMDLAALGLITAGYYPAEGVTLALATALPWIPAGFAAYLGAATALLEPSAKGRLFNLAVAAGAAGLFLFPAEPGGYARVLPALLVLFVLMISAVLLPAYRFRYRRAD